MLFNDAISALLIFSSIIFLNKCSNNVKFFKHNTVHNILGLTATYPKDEIKQLLMKDLKLDIDSDKLDLSEDSKDDDHFAQLAKNNSSINDPNDIKLNLESESEGFQESFLNDNKAKQDRSSQDSLDNLGDDLTFDQKDGSSDFAQKDQQNSNQNQSNKSIKDHLLSKQTIEKTSNSIKNFMNNFNKKPSPDKYLDSLHTTTVEQMMMSMLQPKLEEWLNANLPILVEKIIREEISKIIPKN